MSTAGFAAQPSLNKALVLELMRCEWIEKRQNCIALGPSGTGKTHTALGLALAACQKGYSVAFTTAAALVHELMEARDERRLRALQKHLNTVKLLIVDELGYVPFTAAPNCSSRCSASAMNVAPRWSQATCHSMNGLPYSARNGSPAPCSTGSPIMSTSWR
jgi:IstB-like ATP binding protein